MRTLGLMILSLSLLGASTAWAGGAFSTTKGGDPVIWPGGEVFFRLDPGGSEDADISGGGEGGGACMMIPEAHAQTLKGFDGKALVQQAFDKWASVTDGLNITKGPDLPENVTFANAENYYVGRFQVAPFESTVTADPCYNGPQDQCLNSIIFDPHGLITDAILGRCARYSVFGFASQLPLINNNGEIASPNLKAGQMVLNGTCVTPVDVADPSCQGSGWGSSCPVELDDSGKGILGVATHELGHFLGLDHTLVEKELFLKCWSGGCTDGELEKIPTMIGLAVPGLDMYTLTQDDISAMRGFYPDSGTSSCSLTGTVQMSTGDKNGRCFEVVARKQGSSEYKVAVVSGAYVPRKSQGEECGTSTEDWDADTYNECLTSPSATDLKVHTNCNLSSENCGQFEIKGLENGTYDIFVHSFRDNSNGFTIPFFIEPCSQPRNQSGLINDDLDFAATDNPLKSGVNVTCPAGGDAGVIAFD